VAVRESDRYLLIQSVDDIAAAKASQRMAVAFDLEGMVVLDGRIEMVRFYRDLGVRQMLSAYNRNNTAGGGCHDEDGGLTDFGRAVIAEMTFANAEGNMFDLAEFKGYAAAENGGGYPLHPLSTVRAFQSLGINLLSRANNHATDWRDAGIRASSTALDSLGLAHAGAGMSLHEARAPAILTTPKGKVALIAAASTFTGMSPAGNAFRGVGPRPGVNPLRFEAVTLVTRDEMPTLIAIANRIGWQGYDLPGADAKEVRIADRLYGVAERPGMTDVVDPQDRVALLDSIWRARGVADWVVFSIHAHESASGSYVDPTPGDFLRPLFRDLIDAGADMVIRHGPHELQGIEIHQGKPIFYGMGSLFFDLDRKMTAQGPNGPITFEQPAAWFDTMVAMTRFQDRKVRDIVLYPLTINSTPGPARGFPFRATGTEARRILNRLSDLSRAFGTILPG
jgi:poly-gamma-glutamate synthesis protein (capsule biosynthesis protein)